MESNPPSSKSPATPPSLLDQLRACIRTKHYSIGTAAAYVDWARRFFLFHGKRHPRDMGAAEIAAFLSDLAVTRHVAASTQNQARSALVFLYKEVLALELPWLDGIVPAKGETAPRRADGERSAIVGSVD